MAQSISKEQWEEAKKRYGKEFRKIHLEVLKGGIVNSFARNQGHPIRAIGSAITTIKRIEANWKSIMNYDEES